MSLYLLLIGLGVKRVVEVDVERNFERFDLHPNLLLTPFKKVLLLVDLLRRGVEVERLRCFFDKR